MTKTAKLFRNHVFLVLIIGAAGLTILTGCKKVVEKTSSGNESSKKTAKPASTSKPDNTKAGANDTSGAVDNERVVIETKKGKMVIELYPDVAPKTVANFKKLISQGFYNGLTFHRVEPNFVIQGGDPKGNGTGGPGYTIPAEFNNKKHLRGTVAMARSQDPDSAGSQFYICIAPQPTLDGKYTVFGQVVEGIETVDLIEVGDTMDRVYLESAEATPTD